MYLRSLKTEPNIEVVVVPFGVFQYLREGVVLLDIFLSSEKHCFSRCGPWTNSSSLICELVRKTNSGSRPRATESETLEVSPVSLLCPLQSKWFRCQLKFKNRWSKRCSPLSKLSTLNLKVFWTLSNLRDWLSLCMTLIRCRWNIYWMNELKKYWHWQYEVLARKWSDRNFHSLLVTMQNAILKGSFLTSKLFSFL